MIGLMLFPFLSAKIFAAIASDVLQVLVFLGAVVGAIVVWHGTLMPVTASGLTQASKLRITDRLDGIGNELMKLLFFYVLAMIMTIAAKAACSAETPSVREVVRRLEMISHFQRGGTEG